MHKICPACGVTFERESGFFLGSIYVNYGLTALIVAVAYPVLLFNEIVDENVLLLGAFAFVVLFPLWFFRYARSIWMGFDHYWDPRVVGNGGEGKEVKDIRDQKDAKDEKS